MALTSERQALCTSLARRGAGTDSRKRNDRIYLLSELVCVRRPVPCTLCNNMIISADWACAWVVGVVEVVGGGGGGAQQRHLKEKVTAFSRDRRQSHIHCSIFSNNRAGPSAGLQVENACVCVCVLCNCGGCTPIFVFVPIVKRLEGVVNFQQMIEN